MPAWVGWIGFFLLTIGVLRVLQVPQRRGWRAQLRGLAGSLVLLAVGALCLALATALRSFEAFSQATAVAQVQCRWLGEKTFELTYVPTRDGELQDTKVFQLRGDQWAISGGIVKWHPWLTAMGLSSYHKPTRISGRYANVSEETQQPPTAFALDGELDRIWWWLYRLDPVLPFIEAAYGSSAYVYVNPALRFEVSVTPSGYLIERARLGTSPSRR